jgi:two-component system OmpR family sensor kinase
MYSLRRTLAVRFSLTIFVALCFIALWAFLGTRRILRDALDRNLSGAAQLEIAVVASRLPLAIHPTSTDLDGFIHTVNRFVAVRDSVGRIVEANTPFAEQLPLDQDSFEAARRGEPAWTTASWHGRSVRSYYVRAPERSRPYHAVIQVAAAFDSVARASRQVLFLMLGTVFLGTVAAVLGAGWLADSSVAPVAAITSQAQDVRGMPRGQRITAHADSEEFAGLLEVLNGMLERLDRAFESQRRMIADAGHDLRTPLTAMRAQVEVALRGERQPADYQTVLRGVLEEVEHLTALSESLILLARLETGALSPDCRELDLVTLADRAVRTARQRADGRTIEGPVVEGETTAAVDAKMIGVTFDQLLDNAIKHTEPDTRVRVTLRGTADAIAITVEDSGAGLPPEILPHLFEHFYRQDEARSRDGAGTMGLGLTLVAELARAHSGAATADQSSLGGLRIVITLPRHPPT